MSEDKWYGQISMQHSLVTLGDNKEFLLKPSSLLARTMLTKYCQNSSLCGDQLETALQMLCFLWGSNADSLTPFVLCPFGRAVWFASSLSIREIYHWSSSPTPNDGSTFSQGKSIHDTVSQRSDNGHLCVLSRIFDDQQATTVF